MLRSRSASSPAAWYACLTSASNCSSVLGSVASGSRNTATGLSRRGAAWIAHDRHRLCLAKPFEILDADNTYVPIIHAGQALPVEGHTQQVPVNFYCVDPRDGVAKLQFARPKQPSRVQPPDPRQVYTTLMLRVDPRARPLVERLAVNITIDENLVVYVSAESTVRLDKVDAAIHDLEFGLRLDGSSAPMRGGDTDEGSGADSSRTQSGARPVANPAAVALRSNVHSAQHENRRYSWRDDQVGYTVGPSPIDSVRSTTTTSRAAAVIVFSTRFSGMVARIPLVPNPDYR